MVDTILQDRWDRDDFQGAHDTMPPLSNAIDTLAQVSDIGADMGRDVFAALHRQTPIPAPDVPPSHALNRAVRDAILDSPAYQRLHPQVAGDPMLAGMATAAMTDEVSRLYGELDHVREAAEKAQAAEQAVTDALDAALDGDGPPDDDAQAMIDSLRETAAGAEADLAEALSGAEAKIGKAGRAAAQAAADETGNLVATLGGWGLDGGTLAKIEPTRRFHLMQLLRTDRMARITGYFGRFKAMVGGARDRRWVRGPDEIVDLEFGNDLDRVVPDEWASRRTPGMRRDFLRRYVDGELICYRSRKRHKVGRGPVVFVEDSSASMAGAPYEVTKGCGLAMASIAHSERRDFRAILFGGRGKVVEMTVTAEPESMIDYASAFLDDGGTDFAGPLDRAVGIVDGELTDADIVLFSDGHAHLDDDWVEQFAERKAALGFRLWVVLVGDHRSAKTLDRIADRIALIEDLISDDTDVAIAQVFTDLTTERTRAA